MTEQITARPATPLELDETKRTNEYHTFGLLAELISVGHYKIEHMPSVSIALNFLLEARQKYESDYPAPGPAEDKEENETAAQTNGSDIGSPDTSYVPQT